MQSLLALDHQLFLMINHLPHTQLLDWIALFFSGVGNAGIVWVSIGIYLFFREEQKVISFFVPVVIAFTSCWFLVEWMLKLFFHRLRPSVFDGAYIVGSAGWYSFPSSHAAISWAMAVVLSQYEPRLKWVWYALALCISLSRIYLGVHYPLDVIVGGCIGFCIGKIACSFRKRRQGAKTRGRVPRDRRRKK